MLIAFIASLLHKLDSLMKDLFRYLAETYV